MTSDKNEIHFQYPSDYWNDRSTWGSDAAVADPTGTLEYRGNGSSGFHQGDAMYDEGDRRNPDLAHGHAYQEQDEFVANGLSILKLADEALGSTGISAPLGYEDEDDEAGRWLKAQKMLAQGEKE